MYFKIQDYHPIATGQIVKDSVRLQTVGNTAWFTNLDHSRRHDEVPLLRRYSDDPAAYPKYENFDAIEVGFDEGPVILSAGATAADTLPGLEGTDLNRKVRDEIYRQLSGHYGDFSVPTPKEAQAVIDAVAGHLLNAVPDDSADDVREALGL